MSYIYAYTVYIHIYMQYLFFNIHLPILRTHVCSGCAIAMWIVYWDTYTYIYIYIYKLNWMRI